jgi:hypothetical protein
MQHFSIAELPTCTTISRLGTGYRLSGIPTGPRKIYRIAQIRHKALTQGVVMLTIIHEYRGYVDTPDGLHVIDSPSLRVTTEERVTANDYVSRASHGPGASAP